MIQISSAFALAFVLLSALLGFFGNGPVYLIAYGTVCIWAAHISLTFAYAYFKNRDNLALAMAVSWAGTATVQGWWWVFNLFGNPGWMIGHWGLYVGIALYMAGQYHHFRTFRMTLNLPRGADWAALVSGFAISLTAYLIWG